MKDEGRKFSPDNLYPKTKTTLQKLPKPKLRQPLEQRWQLLGAVKTSNQNSSIGQTGNVAVFREPKYRKTKTRKFFR